MCTVTDRGLRYLHVLVHDQSPRSLAMKSVCGDERDVPDSMWPSANEVKVQLNIQHQRLQLPFGERPGRLLTLLFHSFMTPHLKLLVDSCCELTKTLLVYTRETISRLCPHRNVTGEDGSGLKRLENKSRGIDGKPPSDFTEQSSVSQTVSASSTFKHTNGLSRTKRPAPSVYDDCFNV